MWILGGSSQKRQVIFDVYKIDFYTQRIVLDEQGTKLQINKCWRITLRLLLWWMQYVFIWNHAMLFLQYKASMSLVSSKES